MAPPHREASTASQAPALQGLSSICAFLRYLSLFLSFSHRFSEHRARVGQMWWKLVVLGVRET